MDKITHVPDPERLDETEMQLQATEAETAFLIRALSGLEGKVSPTDEVHQRRLLEDFEELHAENWGDDS